MYVHVLLLAVPLVICVPPLFEFVLFEYHVHVYESAAGDVSVIVAVNVLAYCAVPVIATLPPVIDAFCGTGTITLFLARHVRRVYGIEIVSSAIADAKLNARINNVRNAEFIIGDATIILPKLNVQPDVIVLDPPRAGCDEKFLLTIARLQPEKIIYVSCNPATLARDLKILSDNSYNIKKIQPVDMFPFTSHVESVTLLTKDFN